MSWLEVARDVAMCPPVWPSTIPKNFKKVSDITKFIYVCVCNYITYIVTYNRNISISISISIYILICKCNLVFKFYFQNVF
jgi:hypothetical protein